MRDVADGPVIVDVRSFRMCQVCSVRRGPVTGFLPFVLNPLAPWMTGPEAAISPGTPGEMAGMATTGQKLAVTRAYQNAPLKPNGEVSAYLTPRNCSVAFCSLPG